MSRAETQTPGMHDTPYLFGRMGAKHFEPGCREETQTRQTFTQVQDALLGNTLRPGCLVISEWWRFTFKTVLSSLSLSLLGQLEANAGGSLVHSP